MSVRVRRDVYKLGPDWDPALIWYAKGVRELQSRTITVPTSWRYQAAIHGYAPNEDPFGGAGQPLPMAGEQKKYWNQCQHFSWFFLPWHRMYLYCFEHAIQKAIAPLGGPADWSLPYWDYSDTTNPDALKLPPAFRAATLPDGSLNPLRVGERDPDMLAGKPMDAAGTSLDCLKPHVFPGGTSGGSPGFGGPKTLFKHDNGNAFGTLEQTPHGDIHMAVGGAFAGGWMTSFNTAALDPIFWLHHANIDRLWQVWLNLNPAHKNPAGTDWLDTIGVGFDLHDGNGATVHMTPREVVDSTTSPLSYRYEDVSNPLSAATGIALAAGTAVTAPLGPAELVGATVGVALGNAPVTTEVAISQPVGPASAALAAGKQPRILLNIENVKGEGRFPSFAAYINVPLAAAKADDDKTLLAGTLPMFGVREATRSNDEHADNGVTYVLDITELVSQLKQSGNWDPGALRVTFVPIKPGDPDARVRVGRVSIYYQ